MSITLKLNIPAALAKCKLNAAGELFLASEVRRISDPYVPMDTGALKNTAQVEPGRITYPGPYARRQWYEHRGAGLRGPAWVERAMIDHGSEAAQSVASYCGGRAE